MINTVKKKRSRDSIDFDIKMVRGIGLTYFFYGFIYWLELKAFIVPIPYVYLAVPVAGLIMFIRSFFKFHSVLLLFIPQLLIKDLWGGSYPNVAASVVFLVVLAWFLWGSLFIVKKELRKIPSVLPFAISQMVVLVLLFEIDSVVSLLTIFAIGIGATYFLRKSKLEESDPTSLRIALLIQLICILYGLMIFAEVIT